VAVQHRARDALDARLDEPREDQEIENLIRLYGVLRPKKVLPQSEAQECHDNAAAMSGELAARVPLRVGKTKNPETLAYAEKLYKVYLDVFTDAEDYAQTQYFYAELIWSRAGRREEPAPADRAVGERGPSRSPTS
jgi:hypothetical protein